MQNTNKPIQNLDSPESFNVQEHLMSPVARVAVTNGFVRSDRHEKEERYVKKLSNGKEAWLRTSPFMPGDPVEPMHYIDANHGREWGFCISTPTDYGYDLQQLARGTEFVMNALLGAILQRLATWPERLPKPDEPA